MESQVLQRFVLKLTQNFSFCYIPLYRFIWSNLVGVLAFVGLGTSTSKEAKEYFADMKRHRIQFKYSGPEDDAAISLVGLSCILYTF